MKPLSRSNAPMLLERLDGIKDALLRKITVTTPTSITVEFSVQDAHRGFDWINIAFAIDEVSDARLLDERNFKHADMSEGISLVFEAESVGLASGSYNTLATITEAQFYIIGRSAKYEELPFEE